MAADAPSTEDLLDLLAAGDVETFNADRPAGKIELYAADLAGAKLPGVDLAGANLENADLSRAVLSDGMLARADLSGADCTGAKLDGVMALKSRWRGAFLGDADLGSADLTAAELPDLEAPGLQATGITLTGAKLNGADLSRARLDQGTFDEARLNGATCVEADLSGSSFVEASLIEVDFTRARLVGCDLSRARLSSAKLCGADLGNARLGGADLTGADLRGARLAGADLKRADLTDAQLEGVDLSQADLTDAQLDPDVAVTVGRKPALVDLGDTLFIEEPIFAINGERVALLWDNDEDGTPHMRVLAGAMRSKRSKRAAGLPVPADLVLARALVPHGDAFLALVLVERPAGVTVTLCPVDREGLPGVARTLRLPYTPAIRPVIKVEAGEVRIYGISREGPGVHVHRVGDEGLEPLHVSRMSTARGFVSTRDPVVLSKGGVLVNLGPKGPGRPISAPAAFPGRSPCAATTTEGVALGWANKGQPGFYVCLSKPGSPAEPRRMQAEDLAGSIDIEGDGDGAWLAWTQEALVPGAPSTAWIAHLPEDKRWKLELGPDQEPGEVRFCVGRYGKGEEPCVAVSTGDGGWAIASLGKTGPKLRWSTARED